MKIEPGGAGRDVYRDETLQFDCGGRRDISDNDDDDDAGSPMSSRFFSTNKVQPLVLVSFQLFFVATMVLLPWAQRPYHV